MEIYTDREPKEWQTENKTGKKNGINGVNLCDTKISHSNYCGISQVYSINYPPELFTS